MNGIHFLQGKRQACILFSSLVLFGLLPAFKRFNGWLTIAHCTYTYDSYSLAYAIHQRQQHES